MMMMIMMMMIIIIIIIITIPSYCGCMHVYIGYGLTIVHELIILTFRFDIKIIRN
jgi:hypothetical protein